jgi:hypothetical protein
MGQILKGAKRTLSSVSVVEKLWTQVLCPSFSVLSDSTRQFLTLWVGERKGGREGGKEGGTKRGREMGKSCGS